MRFAFVFTLVFISLNTLAQQAPGAASSASHSPTLPPPAAAENSELVQLLRAQTAALKALSSRLDGIERRLEKVEQRSHP